MKSTDVIQPTVLTQPVAVSGTRNEIPQEATGTNKASIKEGFPDITMIAPADGGLPPYGQDFNGLFYSSTDQKVFLQNGGLITFNQDVSDAIGGYPKGAYLDYVANGTYNKVESLIDDNTYNFLENPSYIDNEHWTILGIEGSFANADLSNLTATGQAVIDNKADINLSNLSATGQAVIDNKADINLSNLSATGQAVIDNKADINLSNLSDEGINKLEAQKMYETGNVLTDEQGYNQLVDMAHSTFDSSKLTVVGEPTITEDGIIDNFSDSNYLEYTDDFAFNSCKSFEIVFPAYVVTSYDTGSTKEQEICIFRTGDTNFHYTPIRLSESWHGLYCLVVLCDAEQNEIGTLAISYNTVEGTVLYVKVTWDGSTYTGYSSSDGIEWTKAASIESTTPLGDSDALRFGPVTNTTYTRSYIDMKPFKVVIDGIPVLSFNKTGIDTVKEDNYTLIGSPDVSDEGILSNCSVGNVLQTPVTLSDLAGNSWSIKGSAVLGDESATLVKLSSYPNNVYTTLGGLIWRSNFTYPALYFSARTGTADDDSNEGVHIRANFEIGDTVYYQLNFDYDSGVYSLYADTTDGTTFIGSWTPDTSNKELYYINTHPEYYITLGGGSDSVYYLTTGSIDLNNFLVYINGDLVYQPCLKIPYTLSKTGSKIVDVAYRDRVQNLYEQDGKALYYTLDEDNNNFTLPMGEVYGMITEAAETDLSNLAAVGKSQYNAFSVNTGEVDDSGNPVFITYFSGTNSTMASTVTLSDLTDFQAIKDGSMVINLGGTSYTISGINLSGATSYAGIASILQTAIQANTSGGALWTSSTVTYEETSSSFILTAGVAGAYAIGYATTAEETTSVTGTDISSLIGWSEADEPTITTGEPPALTTSGAFDVTTADGTVYSISDTLTYPTSDLENGKYNIFIDPVTKSISLAQGTISTGVTFPSGAETGDYLLNISQVPYDFQQITITTETDDEGTETTTSTVTKGLNLVLAGTVTISSGEVSLKLNTYNSSSVVGSSSSSIGAPVMTLSDTLDDNEIWLEGAEVSKTTYSALYAIYGDTYGTAGSDDNFVLPDFRNRVLQGSNGFGYISAGLPNITGQAWAGNRNGSGSVTGAFAQTSTEAPWGAGGSGSITNFLATFYASRSSSIYGRSSTVQPPAIKVRVKTRYA